MRPERAGTTAEVPHLRGFHYTLNPIPASLPVLFTAGPSDLKTSFFKNYAALGEMPALPGRPACMPLIWLRPSSALGNLRRLIESECKKLAV